MIFEVKKQCLTVNMLAKRMLLVKSGARKRTSMCQAKRKKTALITPLTRDQKSPLHLGSTLGPLSFFGPPEMGIIVASFEIV